MRPNRRTENRSSGGKMSALGPAPLCDFRKGVSDFLFLKSPYQPKMEKRYVIVIGERIHTRIR